MLTLSYGFKKPQTGDKGNVFFPALEQDIQQLNDHDHNGVNSKKITSQSITGVTDTILAAGWVALGGGNYKQTVTMPPNMFFDTYGMVFRIASGPDAGSEAHLSVKKVSANSYDVFINDNTVNVTVVYLV